MDVSKEPSARLSTSASRSTEAPTSVPGRLQVERNVKYSGYSATRMTFRSSSKNVHVSAGLAVTRESRNQRSPTAPTCFPHRAKG